MESITEKKLLRNNLLNQTITVLKIKFKLLKESVTELKLRKLSLKNKLLNKL